MHNYEAYSSYRKPPFAPSSWVFGPVWTVLYLIIAGSFGYVFVRYFTGHLPAQVAFPFILNLVFNLAFTPLQFKLRSFALASIDIALTLVSLAWAIAAIYPYASWVTFANIPYLLWVCFATVLEFTIFALNRK